MPAAERSPQASHFQPRPAATTQIIPKSAYSILMSELQTPRLFLRKFSADDIDRLAELTSNAGFMRFSGGSVCNRAQAEAMLERLLAPERLGKPSQFAIILRENGKLIGYCGFFLQLVDELEELEIGYRLDPEYWGQGIATEAARAVRDHAFHDLAVERVISLILPENAASKRVAEKNGMRFEKETNFRGFRTQVFAITREEWTRQGQAAPDGAE
jgi:RimJ/RimL family protein N-acetyltransferase